MSTTVMTNFGLPVVKSLASATFHADKMNHNRENRLVATIGFLDDLEVQTIHKMDKERIELKYELSKMRIRMRHGRRSGAKRSTASVTFKTDSPRTKCNSSGEVESVAKVAKDSRSNLGNSSRDTEEVATM